jgi:hypothetical protein
MDVVTRVLLLHRAFAAKHREVFCGVCGGENRVEGIDRDQIAARQRGGARERGRMRARLGVEQFDGRPVTGLAFSVLDVTDEQLTFLQRLLPRNNRDAEWAPVAVLRVDARSDYDVLLQLLEDRRRIGRANIARRLQRAGTAVRRNRTAATRAEAEERCGGKPPASALEDLQAAPRGWGEIAVGGTRTPSLQVRSLLLYPIELRPHALDTVASEREGFEPSIRLYTV